ncbi:hypothetical protein [Komagataeibacter sp. FNDCR2]|uniref:hypothetical protein n=1 Tax=Komagataeibacter sp. FNDCR2 TaxID=2878682 RepID=UPI001E32D993|nr:hypothetical protein [Komagataeibacter sp. FNDCR2]MCE2576052.1 hypothetical protein [Komagataeibacter sp. FNDCR2]
MKRPLPRCYRVPAQLLLASRRFSTDALLIAADAYRELAADLNIHGFSDMAEQAQSLASRLTDEAPGRAQALPILFPTRHKGKIHGYH